MLPTEVDDVIGIESLHQRGAVGHACLLVETGARLLVATRTRLLRIVFAVVIFVLGIEMIINGITGSH